MGWLEIVWRASLKCIEERQKRDWGCFAAGNHRKQAISSDTTSVKVKFETTAVTLLGEYHVVHAKL